MIQRTWWTRDQRKTPGSRVLKQRTVIHDENVTLDVSITDLLHTVHPDGGFATDQVILKGREGEIVYERFTGD